MSFLENFLCCHSDTDEHEILFLNEFGLGKHHTLHNNTTTINRINYTNSNNNTSSNNCMNIYDSNINNPLLTNENSLNMNNKPISNDSTHWNIDKNNLFISSNQSNHISNHNSYPNSNSSYHANNNNLLNSNMIPIFQLEPYQDLDTIHGSNSSSSLNNDILSKTDTDNTTDILQNIYQDPLYMNDFEDTIDEDPTLYLEGIENEEDFLLMNLLDNNYLSSNLLYQSNLMNDSNRNIENDINEMIESVTDPVGKFLRSRNLTAQQVISLNIHELILNAPKTPRQKYGRRDDYLNKHKEYDKTYINRIRNREHARATRARRKLFEQIDHILDSTSSNQSSS